MQSFYFSSLTIKFMKTAQQIVTENRIAQKVVLEILVDSCPDLTIGKAKDLARVISVQVSNAIYRLQRNKMIITDAQANSLSYWLGKLTGK